MRPTRVGVRLTVVAAAAAWLVCAQAFAGAVGVSASAPAPAGPPAAVFGGVTNIKEVVNRTPQVITLGKCDRNVFSSTIFRPSDCESTKDIPPNGVWTGDMWVPWADEKEQLFHHFMALSVRAPNSDEYKNLFLIWQTGEYVRSVTAREDVRQIEQYVTNAPRAPGEARAGGERRVVVGMKGEKIVFTFEKYEPRR